MSDLRVFHVSDQAVSLLEAQTLALEKSLQTLIEKNLDGVLSVRFLASEYTTGAKHGGRIDTLGLNENDCPVIIELVGWVEERNPASGHRTLACWDSLRSSQPTI